MFQQSENRRKLLAGITRGTAAICIAAMTIFSFTSSGSAQTLLEKIKNGETIRIGFTVDPPGAFVGPNGEPLGSTNEIARAVLKKMGTNKVEAVVTDWASLVPGLQAGRFDIITAGMWIKPDRCKNVAFSEPFMLNIDGLVVPKGNPEALHSYEDVRDKGLTLVTGTGYVSVPMAQKAGIPDDKIMQVPGNPEIIQALKAGRAAAGILDSFAAARLLPTEPGLELTELKGEGPSGYPAFAFSLNEKGAADAFSAVLMEYLGSDEMMATVSKYGYRKADLPDGKKAAELCKG